MPAPNRWRTRAFRRSILSMYQTSPKELAIFLRGQLDPGAIPEQVHEQVQSVNPELPVFGAQTLDDALSASLAERRFSMEMVASIRRDGACCSRARNLRNDFVCGQRAHTRDWHSPRARGERGKILEMVLRQGLGLAIAGTAVGLVGALIVSHLMAGLLYGVAPTDPLTFVGVTLCLRRWRWRPAISLRGGPCGSIRWLRCDMSSLIQLSL